MVCGLAYPASNAHAPHYQYVARPALQYIFHISHKRHDFRKNVTEHKMCGLIFSTTFVWNISHSKKNWARYDKKCVLVFMRSTGYSCQILMKLELSWWIFEKYSNINSHENPSSGIRFVPCGRTDRQVESNSRFFTILRPPLKTNQLNNVVQSNNGCLFWEPDKQNITLLSECENFWSLKLVVHKVTTGL